MQPLTIDLPEATRTEPTGRDRDTAGLHPALALRRRRRPGARPGRGTRRGRGRGHARHQGAPGDRRRARPGGVGRGGLGGADGRDDPPPGTARPVGDRRGRGDPPRSGRGHRRRPRGRRCCWSPGWSRSPSPSGGTATARPGHGIWPPCRPRAIVASVRQTRPVTDLPVRSLAAARRIGLHQYGPRVGVLVDAFRVELRAKHEDSTIAVAPPRGHKTAAVVIPRVLDAPGAVVTTSTKADVLLATSTRRATVGHRSGCSTPRTSPCPFAPTWQPAAVEPPGRLPGSGRGDPPSLGTGRRQADGRCPERGLLLRRRQRGAAVLADGRRRSPDTRSPS